MEKIYTLANLDCANCAAKIEAKFNAHPQVEKAVIVFPTRQLRLLAENPDTLVAELQQLARTVESEVTIQPEGHVHSHDCHCDHNHCHHEHHHDHHPQHSELTPILAGAAFFVLGLVLSAFSLPILPQIAFIAAYLLLGWQVIAAAGKNLVKGHLFDENFLMSVASVGAIALGEIYEGVAVLWLYQLGELLQSVAVGSSRKSVIELVKLKSEQATLLRDGQEIVVKPEQLQTGDIVLVKAGERVPADGVLLSEGAQLDGKSLTGEAEILQKQKGEEILSGCINVGGVYEMKVLRSYRDSAVNKILSLVEEASANKAQPEKFISRFAKYYTPIVCILAVVMAVGAPVVSRLTLGVWEQGIFQRWIQTALTFLVISCPCALIISVPLTYFLGIGGCAKQGVLVKGAVYLDVLAKTKTFAFDKTGTLTKGDFTVKGIYPSGEMTKSQLVLLAAAVEKGSSHPIAKAFDEYVPSIRADQIKEFAGKGVCGVVEKEQVVVGSARLLREYCIEFDEAQSDESIVYVAKNGVYVGWIEIGDAVRQESKQVISDLKKLGIDRVVMLTGDNEQKARIVANEIGMYELKAKLLPDEKLEEAEYLKNFGALAYVGDGINDAPVMAASDCAVSLGKLGSAAAVEASDIVLIADDLRGLVTCVKTAKKTAGIVKQNIIFSICMKAVFMALGVAGALPLALAVFADVGVMLLAVCNSLRVRKI